MAALEATLEGPSFTVVHCASEAEVLGLAAERSVDLVAAPFSLPPDGGLAFSRRLRQNLTSVGLPVVLVLASDDAAARAACAEAGVDDYLAPPLAPAEVHTRLCLARARALRMVLVNPLTGLPGNQEIHRRLEESIGERRPFAACYVDLDNFKAFNDHYGFKQGDLVIIFVARILVDAVQELGSPDDFVGHIGGDDFLLLTTPERVSAISARAITRFDAEIGHLYRKEDLLRGYILTWDRGGNVQETPIMSLSVAVATNAHREIRHIGEVGAILADLKQYVKLLPGSNYVVDRRTDSPGAAPNFGSVRDESWRQLVLTDYRTHAFGEPSGQVPSVMELMEQVATLFRQTGRLGTICITATALSGAEEAPGWTEIPAVSARIGRILLGMRGRIFRRQDLVVTSPTHEDAFFVFLAPPRGSGTGRLDELERVADRVRTAVLAELVAELGRIESQRFQLETGASQIRGKGGPLARLVYQGLDAAMRAAARRSRRDRGQQASQLRRLLETGQIRALLQPVVSLRGGMILGYEALSRGPRGSDIEAPTQLFRVARSADLVWTLDRLCHRIAVSQAAGFPPTARLFLNCDPELARDPEFRRLSAADYAELAGRPIVLEVPEESLARRLGLVRAAVATFREQGFEIAIDHTSTEFRVLRPLAELRPHYLKFDVSLVRGIDQDSARQELLGAMTRFAKRIGAANVASGVETEGEATTLTDLGLEYAQGKFFAPMLEPE
jgi:diguanylate cyclase (GGDEF)-like protein